MSQLLTPVRIGSFTASNRLVMAPMTRSRADDQGVPGDITVTYYAQRAGAGLIITEGVFPSAMGKGYVRTPGIETEAQAAGWKKVTEAVHARGGRIFLQLMHCGRISHPSLLDGAMPVAPSAIKPEGQAWTPDGQVDYVTPRELSVAEIADVIDDYAQATRHAIDVGFDGKFRDECLTMEWFRNRVEARVVIDDWRQHYNRVRLHSSLNYDTPEAFSKKAVKTLSTEAIPD